MIRYCQDKPKFKRVSAKNILPKTMKDGSYIINFEKYKSIGMHWMPFMLMVRAQDTLIALMLNTFQKKYKKIVDEKNVIKYFFKIQAYDSIICEYFCTGFIGSLFRGKRPTRFMNIFLPHHSKKSNKVILNYFLK